jgi:hypothetical protein
MGVERLLHDLNTVTLDKQGDYYELVSLDIDSRPRPYLKMLNPSIGEWHIEGVHPECMTVTSALNWRNQSTETPQQLT